MTKWELQSVVYTAEKKKMLMLNIGLGELEIRIDVLSSFWSSFTDSGTVYRSTYTRNETNLLTVEVDASAPNVTAEHPGRPPVYISCVGTQEKY